MMETNTFQRSHHERVLFCGLANLLQALQVEYEIPNSDILILANAFTTKPKDLIACKMLLGMWLETNSFRSTLVRNLISVALKDVCNLLDLTEVPNQRTAPFKYPHNVYAIIKDGKFEIVEKTIELFEEDIDCVKPYHNIGFYKGVEGNWKCQLIELNDGTKMIVVI